MDICHKVNTFLSILKICPGHIDTFHACKLLPPTTDA